MCETCGCGIAEHAHPHGDAHDHSHGHSHGHGYDKTVKVEEDLLEKNNRQAEANRAYLSRRGVKAFNLLSAPGSGKTTLLEQTIAYLGERVLAAVIEGDQQTDRDARRIATAGAPVVQVNTGAVCHLDAAMVARALKDLPLDGCRLLFIENVGNLICPALFDLGESKRVVLLSVTEGEDKPLKYPQMFRAADLVVFNKIDLLPHVEFDPNRCEEYLRRVNPKAPVLPLSARTGEGMEEWYEWVMKQQ